MSIDERFQQFHSRNPDIYTALVKLARAAKAKGRVRAGVKWLVEVVRWNHYFNSGDEFKISNDFTSRYSRLIMQNEPDLAGFFVTKALKSTGTDGDGFDYDYGFPDLDDDEND